jgi:hypothetical protein
LLSSQAAERLVAKSFLEVQAKSDGRATVNIDRNSKQNQEAELCSILLTENVFAFLNSLFGTGHQIGTN